MPRTANNGVNVEVSSWNKNNKLEAGKYEKLSDVLRAYDVDMADSVVQVIGEDGDERTVPPAGKLVENDTILIMKAKNKSGN